MQRRLHSLLALQRQIHQHQQLVAGVEGLRTRAFLADWVERKLPAGRQELLNPALLHPSAERSRDHVQSVMPSVARCDVGKLAGAV